MHQHTTPAFGHIRIHRADCCTVIAFHGEIDIAAAAAITPRLDAATAIPRCRIVLDLGGVEFIDACGLGLLCRARLRVMAGGGRLVLVCDHPRTLLLLQITGMDSVFTVTASMAEALDQCAGPAAD
ncbi:anti-sigma B factor antagonist [Streptomyces sp. V4I8]|uniref:STAS domain-containing protein n=1 Tax=Streptomyces sp. V4I8 TaxID=3156469 RepID=UPI003514A9F8